MKNIVRADATGILLCVLVAFSGCDSSPHGRGLGGESPTTATDGERASKQVSNGQLDESVELSVTQLLGDLQSIPELTSEPRSKGVRATIVLGDLNVRGPNVSKTDFELYRSELRRKLATSPALTQTVRIIENRAAMAGNRYRERPAPPPRSAPASDPLHQGNVAPPQPVVFETFDSSGTFYLDGELFSREVAGTYRYSIGWNLVRDSDATIIWASTAVKEKR